MKFSVLLPTRNRLEYLQQSIETIRRQDYGDWEVIVSDNCSEQDVAGFVVALSDPRVRYVRTTQFVPVTDNWNNALAHSTGDYVIMLGDDDGLLPGYFSLLAATMKNHESPDFVYVGAYYFAFPGAVPQSPDGFLCLDRNAFFSGAEPYWLPRQPALRIADGYRRFRMPVASNMQFSLISRHMLNKLSRDQPFFRSPFPDFYATPLLFYCAERILIVPTPLVMIGITPKSYGAFHFSNRATVGVSFLGNAASLQDADRIDRVRMPGTSYYDSWLLAAEALYRQCVGMGFPRPQYNRYRFLQILHLYKKRWLNGQYNEVDWRDMRRRMHRIEWLVYGSLLPVGLFVLTLLPSGLLSNVMRMLRKLIGQHAISNASPTTESFSNMIDVYEFFATRDRR